MPSHTDPSIIDVINGIELLEKKFSKLTIKLITDLKGAFSKSIPFPKAVDATILNIEESICRYPHSINVDEFVNGSISSLDREYWQAHPEVAQLIGEVVHNVVSISLLLSKTYVNSLYYQTKSTNGVYVSAGASIQSCSPRDWLPIDKPFYAASILLGVWSPNKPYDGYPEPVNIAPPIPR